MNPPCTAEGHLAILARQGVVATAAEPEQFEEPISRKAKLRDIARCEQASKCDPPVSSTSAQDRAEGRAGDIDGERIEDPPSGRPRGGGARCRSVPGEMNAPSAMDPVAIEDRRIDPTRRSCGFAFRWRARCHRIGAGGLPVCEGSPGPRRRWCRHRRRAPPHPHRPSCADREGSRPRVVPSP